MLIYVLLGRNHVGCGCSNDTGRHDTELFGVPNGRSTGPRKTKQVRWLKGRDLRTNDEGNLVIPWSRDLKTCEY